VAERLSSEWQRAVEDIVGGSTGDAQESQTLEFKSEATDLKTFVDVAEAAACLANASGGVVVVGIEDDVPGKDGLSGTALDEHLVQGEIYRRTQPPLMVSVLAAEVEGARLLVVTVPRGMEPHADTKGVVRKRFGKACNTLMPQHVATLSQERRGVDLSAVPTDRILADVSAAAIEVAREQLGSLPDRRSELAELSVPDLLRALGLVAEDGAHLTVAGELLFCRPASATQFAIVYQYRQTPGGEPQHLERLAQPVLRAHLRAQDLVAARRITTPLSLPNGQQLALEDFPREAVREALANALMHQDLSRASPVDITHSPEQLAIASPGPLVDGVTPENILTVPSRPRNRSLAQAFRTLGLAEEAGVGVDRMYREMIRAGRDVPRWEASPDLVRVGLGGGAPLTPLARFVATLDSREREDTDTMLVLLALTRTRVVNGPRLSAVLQKSSDEVASILGRLAHETRLIEATRETARSATPNYRLRSDVVTALGSALSYRRRTKDDIDRRIIAHVQEYHRVTNSTVRNLLEISTPRASAILRDLCDREILEKTSSASRGPTVEYGPGPEFATHAGPEHPDQFRLFDR